ncbi:MAG: GTP-binding protein [Limnohabitans sp.]|nr:MAG: GTP-binding protein [Limnohabitans sp.]
MSGTSGIAVTVVGGFLGAGKTTLLNRWLQGQGSSRVAVLVNDFGALNIDAQWIAARHGDTFALTNGCICCQMGGDLSQALIRVLDAPQPFDEVWIEASGVSDPGRIARLARSAPEFAVKGVIVLVDCTRITAQLEDPLLRDTLVTQICSADELRLSKTDLADDRQVQSALESLWPLNARALVQAGVDHPAEHAEACHAPDARVSAVWTLGPAHGRRFAAWAGCPDITLSVAQWQRRLHALPPQVLRLKGFVRTTEHGWTMVQLAGRRAHLEPFSASVPAKATLIAIGLRGDLPREALKRLLHA